MGRERDELEKRLDYLEEIVCYSKRRKTKKYHYDSPIIASPNSNPKAYSDEYGSLASSGDERNPRLDVKKMNVFDEIKYKVKNSEQAFKTGMMTNQTNYLMYKDEINGRLFDMDQMI